MSARPETRRARYVNDPAYRAKCLANSRAYYREHKDEIRERRKIWRKARRADPDYRTDERLRYKYGLTLADYRRMVEAQQGLCAICFTQPAERLRVDHDHATRQVRGLLCAKCNLGLGHFEDDLLVLLSAANFLLLAKRRAKADAKAKKKECGPVTDGMVIGC
jgi:hypothetical protein